MKRFILFFFLLIVFQSSIGQEAYRTFGKVSPADLEIKTCDFEPDASAVVIFDEGRTIISKNDEGFNYILERQVRIKILKEAGVHWSEVEIPYYNSKSVNERVYDIQAQSYNFEDNKLNVTELKQSDCHEEKINENWSRKKFAIPNARVGSVIEYTYKYESDYMFNLPDWEFQWKIPVMNSRYKMGMVPFYTYQFLLQGASNFDEFHKEQSSGFEREYFGVKFADMDYSFGMKNIPSFKDETYITTQSDYIMKIDFQLAQINYPNGTKVEVLTSWPSLIKDLNEDDEFGKFAKAAQKQASKIINIGELMKMPEQVRFDSIITFVKKRFQWNDKFSLQAQQKLKELVETGRGNSSEINLFTIGLLNAAGIKSYPVILSTRSHGKVKTSYPFLNSFNNTIILSNVENGQILSDATDLMIANNRLPMACINDLGLIILPGKENWVGLYSKNSGKTKTTIQSIIQNGIMVSETRILATDYDGLFMRKNYGTDRETLIKHLTGENDNVIDSTLIIKNMENSKSPYELRYTVENKPGMSDNNIYVQPFLREVPAENIFKTPTRTYPVDLIYPYQRSFAASVVIPAGYEVSFLPENKRLSMTDLELDYQISQKDDQLLISLVYSLKKAIYSPEEYKNLRFFFSELVSKANEKIVLKKK